MRINNIEILKKKKNIIIEILYHIFVNGVLSYYLLQKVLKNSSFSTSVLSGITAVYVVLLLLGLWSILTKKEKQRLGISINEEGINDFSSRKNNLGLIRWEDIEQVRTRTSFLNEPKLILMVKNPLDYIQNASGWQLKKKMRLANRKWGTPIVIEVNGFKEKPEELKELIKNRLNSYRK